MYASDFWGCLKLPQKNPIETLHVKFCKELLGVQKQTTNLGVLLELGRLPLHIFAKKNCIKNWERIAIKKHANMITLSSCNSTLEENTGWKYSIKDYLSSIGLMNIFLRQNQRHPPNVEAFNREKDMFYQKSFFEIQNNYPKLMTYGKIKKDIGIEPYLINIKNIENRIMMSKFRLSNHTLMIEKGRHKNILRENRYCPFCKNCVEDEIHFLIKCPTYANYRKKLLDSVLNNNDSDLSGEELFCFLMEDDKAVTRTANFLTLAISMRENKISLCYNQ